MNKETIKQFLKPERKKIIYSVIIALFLLYSLVIGDIYGFKTAFQTFFLITLLISLPLLFIVFFIPAYMISTICVNLKLTDFLRYDNKKFTVFVLLTLVSLTIGVYDHVSCGKICGGVVPCNPSGVEKDLFIWQDYDICPEGEFPSCRYHLNAFLWAPNLFPSFINNLLEGRAIHGYGHAYCGLFNLENNFLLAFPLSLIYWYILSCLIIFAYDKFKYRK